MYNMKNLILIFSLSLVNFLSLSQQCNDIFTYRKPTIGFEIDSQAKSSLCRSDSMYSYTFSVTSCKEYRFSLYAGAVFNAKVNFVITNSKGKILFDLQGDEDTLMKKPVALRNRFVNGKSIYPYFAFISETDDIYTLKVTTEKLVHIRERISELGEPYTEVIPYIVTGCVTFYLQSKQLEVSEF